MATNAAHTIRLLLVDTPERQRRFAVVGADPHGLDGNSDVVGCESD